MGKIIRINSNTYQYVQGEKENQYGNQGIISDSKLQNEVVKVQAK